MVLKSEVEELVGAVRPYSVPCFDYLGKDHRYRRVTAIVVPIGFETVNGKTIISWECSKGISCRNFDCRYSKAERHPVQESEGGVRFVQEY